MWMRFPGRLTGLAFILAVAASVSAGAGDWEDFDAYVREGMEAWKVPGLALAVVKDGETVFLRGYGVQSLENGDSVNPQTRFAIASTTKAMTAATIGMLVDEGKVKWDTRVHEILPDLKLHDPWMTRELTVRDLLTHRAGLGNADFLWYGQDTSTSDILQRIRLAPPAYSPRSGFVYQNIMYGAAGEVVRVLSGQSWEQFSSERLFQPLGMGGTGPTLNWLEGQPNIVTPHHLIDERVQVIKTDRVASIPAAGAGWSSVEDMSKWMTFLLEGGVAPDGRRLLSEEALEELFHPQVVLRRANFYPTAKLTEPKWITYGLGWFQHDYHGHKVDFHTGSIDGLVAIVGLIRDLNLGICVLANLDHAELRHALMYRVFDSFLGRTPRDWSNDLQVVYGELRKQARERRQKEEEARVTGTSPSLTLAGYAGEYLDPLYGMVRVTHAADRLRLDFGDQLTGELEHWHYDTFRLHWQRAWMGKDLVTFTFNSRGEPETIRFPRGMELKRVQPEK